MQEKKDGSSYAPKGKACAVCGPGEFPVGVIGLDHGHIYGMCNGLSEAGADIVKLFPADDMGYHYIWNLKGPLPHIPLLASGGVNPDTIPKYLEQGVAAVGTGVSIINRDMLAADDYEGITALARRHVDAIRNFKKA
jgi:hypothetical protein